MARNQTVKTAEHCHKFLTAEKSALFLCFFFLHRFSFTLASYSIGYRRKPFAQVTAHSKLTSSLSALLNDVLRSPYFSHSSNTRQYPVTLTLKHDWMSQAALSGQPLCVEKLFICAFDWQQRHLATIYTTKQAKAVMRVT